MIDPATNQVLLDEEGGGGGDNNSEIQMYPKGREQKLAA